jgi:hypothetical protein
MRITFLHAPGKQPALAASYRGQADAVAGHGHAVTHVTVDGAGADLHRLGSRRDDLVVVADPTLLVRAAHRLPAGVALAYQEHRVAQQMPRDSDLVQVADRLSVVVTSQRATARRLEQDLAATGTRIEVLPEIAWCAPEPAFRPRSSLETRLLVAQAQLTSNASFNPLMLALSRIADRLPGWRVRIFGDGPAREGLLRPIRKHSLFDTVELPGTSEVPALEWSRASIALHVAPSPELPAHARDAMGAGVPMVAFDDSSSARDFVVHEENGLLVPPASPVGLAAALLRLVEDDRLRHDLGQGAHDWFQSRARTVDVARLVQVYEAAARRPAPSPTRSSAPDPSVTDLSMTPLTARSTALRLAVGAAARTRDIWFVIPPAGVSTPATVVVPGPAQGRFLDELATGAPEWMSLVAPDAAVEPARRGSVEQLAAELRHGRVPWLRLEPWPTRDGRPHHLSQGCAVDVEFWEPAPSGHLTAPRLNRYTRTVRPDTELAPLTIDGVEARTLPLMTVPTVFDCTFPIDLVYTWVDGDDPEWAARRLSRLAASRALAQTRESSGRARFVSRDELRYSLRSVHLFAPWVRRIHLVTDAQRPAWLADHPKINLVDHRDILPAEALPTFNSHAIEAALHRIPGLAPHWVYLNDDVFLGRPVAPETLFTAAGQPFFFPTEAGVGSADTVDDVRPWMLAHWNNRGLLEQAFGVTNPTSLMHSPHPQATSILTEIEERFPQHVERTRLAPFRSETDLALLSSLAQHYGAATGQAVRGTCRCVYVDLASANVLLQLRRLGERDADFFCLGDHHDHALPPERLREALNGFLGAYFPVAAPWERPTPSA